MICYHHHAAAKLSKVIVKSRSPSVSTYTYLVTIRIHIILCTMYDMIFSPTRPKRVDDSRMRTCFFPSLSRSLRRPYYGTVCTYHTHTHTHIHPCCSHPIHITGYMRPKYFMMWCALHILGQVRAGVYNFIFGHKVIMSVS